MNKPTICAPKGEGCTRQNFARVFMLAAFLMVAAVSLNCNFDNCDIAAGMTRPAIGSALVIR